jgi:hypothetical protein
MIFLSTKIDDGRYSSTKKDATLVIKITFDGTNSTPERFSQFLCEECNRWERVLCQPKLDRIDPSCRRVQGMTTIGFRSGSLEGLCEER